ncbi:MBL fold metallo-hydrolase [Tenuifilum sp.]|uniref:MBL fold metallo-hydrolase n=1 Tax=Tenuifilum sp. TaxID=2760880 RepID=UPI001B4CC955|nr:MBL fold metallo-hydrolase [Bacteroidales bacterium]HQE55070.1 MBL fold metallo-hydrolase [Tenuifilum sp.]MBP9028554.1 MBL fold metallo-hydrolase [Bacteroidales bacterium]HQG72888.1 MBL fold metallo-hydrolase [Tenuifilum sp.]HQI89693.1 MBL fold metallo-hydrolase [Tenuifilum sp.]
MRANLLFAAFSIVSTILFAQKTDFFTSSNGNTLRIAHIGHGTLMFNFRGKVIHIDPWSRLASYDSLPKADYIFLTHHHGDHLDSVALSKVFATNTQLYWTKICAEQSKLKLEGKVVANGDTIATPDFRFIAVPAYNIVNKRPNGNPFHPKGEGNGYIFEFDNLRVYVAGDTENIPEMEDFGKIDMAFLPANLPYTMSPEMLKAAVMMLKPKILYPYHTGNTDLKALNDILVDVDVEVRFRDLK